MRSINSDEETATNEVPSHGMREEAVDNIQASLKRKVKLRQEKDGENVTSATVKRPQKAQGSRAQKPGLADLTKEDLLRLLGVMEGEVQAREDIIQMMKSERVRGDSLEAHYGSAVPFRALKSLYRDGLVTKSKSICEDVYQKPMEELDRLEDKHRETYRRMLEQLLLAEKCHRRTVNELNNEKRKHADYMSKSDEFTTLLEQERERLKRLLEQEKAYQARKDKEHKQRLEKVREELVKLKSFSLMLVEERQLHVEQIEQQSKRVQGLNHRLQEKEQKLSAISGKAKEDSQRIIKLEAELDQKTAKLAQEHEEMTAKLAVQESQNRQLRLKLAGLARRTEELEESNKVLKKSDVELQEMREKISKGEYGNSSLMAELENLRKRVLEMEGKDEEITKTESQCKELWEKLQKEENHSRELKMEVEKLQKRMVDIEKLEVSFSVSRSQCAQLHSNLEKEKYLTKDMVKELETVKKRVKELESSESRLEKAEIGLKDDLTKLKSFTVVLVDERKNMADRIKQEEKKTEGLNTMLKEEQSKVMEVTEKLIEESKKFLKLKSEMEAKVTIITKEKDELKLKLASAEEKCKDLSSEAKSRVGVLDGVERGCASSRVKIELAQLKSDDNKIKELTTEIERLRNRLQQLEVVEGDLMKTEDEYDSLEKKFRTEQEKANVLSQLLDEMKTQIARSKAIEKGEAVSQEAELRQRCKLEEAKTRDLQTDVQALKEKIHELMNKEDQLSQLQVEYSLLQQRFIEEENKKKSMSQEVLNLTKELEATKRYSRALRPSINGRRIVDVPVTSTGIQTDVFPIEPTEEDTAAMFIRKSVQEENHIMSNLRHKELKKPAVLDRYPPAAGEITMKKSWIPWMKKRDSVLQNGPDKLNQVNCESTRKPGQPLHIKVTPDHENSTATLEITSPRAEDFFSTTTIIPTLGLQKPRITIVPKPTTVLSKSKSSEASSVSERAKSPVTITTISRAKSPERDENSTKDKPMTPLSPVSIITVSTSPVTELIRTESQDMGRSIFKVTPEKSMGATTTRKYNSNGNIITTEDNKIHIHLGPQFKRPSESSSPIITVRPVPVTSESREANTETILRSPYQGSATKTGSSKVTSSITITPMTSAPSRATQSVSGQDVQSTRATATRIPVSKGTKPGKAAVAAVTKAESPSMKIELKKSPATGGGKG